MASRSLQDLHELIRPLAYKFVSSCKAEGIEILVTCTLRTLEEQTELYAKGRSSPGKIVTNAQAGSSAHNYGLALDVVPMVGGKPLWDFNQRNLDPIWKRVGELGQAAGLQWFGAPDSPFVEGAHFQLKGWRERIK